MPRLNEADDDAVSSWAYDLGFEEDEFDQSTFLFFCHKLKDYFSIKSQYRRSKDALDVIDIITNEYQGHSFVDLYSIYEKVYVFRVPLDNSMYSDGVTSFGFALCSNFSGARSAIITKSVNDAVKNLGCHAVIPKDNLFQALTSTQWRHFFIEIYRCLESLYYFPWVLELRSAGGFDVPISSLKAYCRSSLEWREREKPSILKIFGSVAADQETIALERKIKKFEQHTNSTPFKREAIGGEVYRMRNSLVHHEDYENPDKMLLTGKEWEEISLYLACILLDYLNDHTHEFSLS